MVKAIAGSRRDATRTRGKSRVRSSESTLNEEFEVSACFTVSARAARASRCQNTLVHHKADLRIAHRHRERQHTSGSVLTLSLREFEHPCQVARDHE